MGKKLKKHKCPHVESFTYKKYCILVIDGETVVYAHRFGHLKDTVITVMREPHEKS